MGFQQDIIPHLARTLNRDSLSNEIRANSVPLLGVLVLTLNFGHFRRYRIPTSTDNINEAVNNACHSAVDRLNKEEQIR